MVTDAITPPSECAGVGPALPAEPRVRVLHIISGLFYGGGQRVVLDLLKQLPATNVVDARLCCLGAHAGSPLAAECEFTIPYDGRYNSPAVLWKTSRQLRALIRSNSFDIVHTHGVDADLIGALALAGRRERHVCHLHISPSTISSESLQRRIRRKLLSTVTTFNRSWFIAVSDAVRDQMGKYYRLPPGRVITVRNGVRLSEFLPATEGSRRSNVSPVVIGTAARLAPMKGLEYLVKAAALLERRGLAFEVRIAGSGSSLEYLQQLTKELEISHRVQFLGQVNDMPLFYRSIDLFALPSVSTEGLPLVILEAMASGKPTVATNLAGIPEVIRDGIDGLLVPPADVQALADALAKLSIEPETRHGMGVAGSARVASCFGLERVAKEVVEVYRKILGND